MVTRRSSKLVGRLPRPPPAGRAAAAAGGLPKPERRLLGRGPRATGGLPGQVPPLTPPHAGAASPPASGPELNMIIVLKAADSGTRKQE